jgi:hypothetical protein
MKIKFIVLFFVLTVSPLFAQDMAAGREEIWVTSVAETNLFSVSNMAFGGGVALGYGDGLSFGFKVVYLIDTSKVKTLEFNFLLRFYLPRLTGHSGLFIQLNGGPVLFAQEGDKVAMPSELGTFSVGVSVGWRFIVSNYFYLEPAVRAGYPYIVGLGLSAGVRF